MYRDQACALVRRRLVAALVNEGVVWAVLPGRDGAAAASGGPTKEGGVWLTVCLTPPDEAAAVVAVTNGSSNVIQLGVDARSCQHQLLLLLLQDGRELGDGGAMGLQKKPWLVRHRVRLLDPLDVVVDDKHAVPTYDGRRLVDPVELFRVIACWRALSDAVVERLCKELHNSVENQGLREKKYFIPFLIVILLFY